MATNPYVNKVEFGNTTVMDITDTTAEENDVASGKVFYKASGARSVGTGSASGEYVTEPELRDTVGWTGKNKIPNTSTTSTAEGVTFTVNADGSVALSGTSASDWVTKHIASNIPIKAGSYILSGCDGGSQPTYRLTLDFATADDVILYDGVREFELANDDTVTVDVTVRTSGTNVNNVVIYPMLRSADIADPTYEPYHESVKQTLRDFEVIEGKNLLDIVSNTYTQTINDVTFTVNSDGTINVNGTATANTFFNVPFVLPIGNFTLTGCPSGGGYANYLAKITDRNGTAITGIGDDSGSGSTFVTATQQDVFYCIRISNGYAASNVLFRPMLRLASETDATFESYYAPLKDRVSTLEGYTNSIVRDSNNNIQEFVSTKVWTLEVATFTNVTRNWYYQLYCLPPSGSSHYGDAVSAIIDHVESVSNPNSSTGYDLKYYVACNAIGVRFRLIEDNNRK